MKKQFITGISVMALSVLTAVPSFAGTWVLGQYNMYQYQDDAGTTVSHCWEPGSDGKQYFLDDNGYMLQNSMTPDGYYVQDDGSWDGKGKYSAEASDEEIEAYKTVLENTKPQNRYDEIDYTLFDLNHDGIEELLINTGTCEADFTWKVYTFNGKRAKSIGSFAQDFGWLQVGSDGALYDDCTHMGEAWLDRVTWDGTGSVNSEYCIDSVELDQYKDNEDGYSDVFSKYGLIDLYHSKKGDYRLLSHSL